MTIPKFKVTAMALMISTLVIGVLAVSADASKWIILNKDVITEVEAGSLNAQVEVTEIEPASEFTDPNGEKLKVKKVALLTEILKIKTEFWCSEVKTISWTLLESAEALGKARFSGCETILNGKLSSVCSPKSTGTEFGTVETNLVNTSIVQHELAEGTKDSYIKTASGKLGTIVMSESCPIGEKVPIIGVLFLKDPELGTYLVSHLIEPGLANGILGDLYAISDTSEHAAKIDGGVKVALTGAHLGFKWAGFAHVKEGTPAKWVILKSAGTIETDAAALKATVNAEVVSTFLTLLAKVLLYKTEISCSGVALIGVTLLGEGKVSGRAEFSGCQIKLNGEAFSKCTPPGGVIETSTASGELVGEVVKVKPEGTAFTTFELPETCPIGGIRFSVSGELYLNDSMLANHSVIHTFESGNSATLSAAGNPATADGSAKVFLTGEHFGLKWAGV